MRLPKPDAQLDRTEREQVLKYASSFTTDRANPDAVVANAKPLLDWLQVRDLTDRVIRFNALSRAYCNRSFTRKPDDDPGKLIAEAEIFYAFLKAA